MDKYSECAGGGIALLKMLTLCMGADSNRARGFFLTPGRNDHHRNRREKKIQSRSR